MAFVLERQETDPARPLAGPGATLRLVRRTAFDAAHYVDAVARAVGLVARSYRLSAAEVEDLTSDVWVRLLERDARVLRRFRGGARIETYLVTIVRNLLLDRRNREWGRWRPSSAARAGGPLAMTLDQMLTRDGWSVDAAEAALKCAGVIGGDTSIGEIAAHLPARLFRRTFVELAALKGTAAIADGGDPAATIDGAAAASRVQRALDSSLARLAECERQLLVWRYVDGLSVNAIAAAIGVEASALYREYYKLLRRLRRELTAAGVDAVTARLADATRQLDVDRHLSAPREASSRKLA